jgi:hypothetical protein
MADDIDLDNAMTNNIDNNVPLIVVDSTQLPVEIQDGIREIVRYYPYKNLTTVDSMGDADFSDIWNVR